jgi:hypothetical protein
MVSGQLEGVWYLKLELPGYSSKGFASKALLARHCRPIDARYRHCDIW